MSQLQLLTDVDVLKRSTTPLRGLVNTGIADETADESAPLSNQLASRQHSSWAKEMNIWDLQLDDDDPTSEATEINIISVTKRTNKFLTEPSCKDFRCGWTEVA